MKCNFYHFLSFFLAKIVFVVQLDTFIETPFSIPLLQKMFFAILLWQESHMEIDFRKTLNERQFEACCSSAQHLRILAGAGTGKTRVLTYRIAFLITKVGLAPNRIVAITFTNKVAKEMNERVTKIMNDSGNNMGAFSPLISTFHGYCYRFLRRECRHLEGFNTKFSVADEDMQKNIFKQVFDLMKLPNEKDLRADIVKKIGGLKSKGLFPEDVRPEMLSSYSLSTPSQVLDSYKLYQQKLKKDNALDFDDLLMYTKKILIENEDVRSYWQRKFDAYLIDEFQDTNLLQYDLIKLLLSPHSLLTVVGDPDQTIYTWRGAESELISSGLPKDFKDLVTVTLDLNYRSTQEILDRANLLIKYNSDRIDKSLTAFDHKQGNDVHYQANSSNKMESALVGNEIIDLRRKGVDYKDIALIYRSNYLSQPLEEFFTKNRIPYIVYGGLKFFDRAEVKDAVAYMKLLINPQDDYAFLRVLKAPLRGIGDQSLAIIEKYADAHNISVFEAVVSHLDELNLKPNLQKRMEEFRTIYWDYESKINTVENDEMKDLIDVYLNKMGFIDHVNQIDTKEDKKNLDSNDSGTRLKNVRALLDQLDSFMNSSHYDEDGKEIEPSLEEFLIDVALQTSQDEIKDANKVTMMTAHVSKGLEFPYVFVVGLDEGIFPTNHALQRGPKAVEEERRLCYVAVTRAKKELWLSSQGGYSYVANNENSPSQFIFEMQLKDNTPKPKAPAYENNSYYGGRGYGQSGRGNYKTYNGYFGSGVNKTKTTKPQEVKVVATHPTGFSKQVGEDYKVGDKVVHVSFGVGDVIGVDKGTITVHFKDPYGDKVLMKGFKAFRKM